MGEPSTTPGPGTRHGGSIRMATIFLTHECNLSCGYCYAIGEICGEPWRVETLEPLLDALAVRGYRLSIGGGEPLMRPELTLEVARRASARGMGTALLTNGHLLGPALLEALAAAGASWVQISADDAAQVRRFAPLVEAGRGLGLAMAIGTVLLPRVLPELAAMHDAMAAAGAEGWRLLRYTPLNAHPLEAAVTTSSGWVDTLLAMERVLRPLDSPVQIRYEPSVVPRAWQEASSAQARLDACGGRRARRLFVYPDGQVFACGVPRRKGIALGSFREQPERFLERLDRVPDEAMLCPESPARSAAYCRDVCRGGCPQLRGDAPCDPRCEREHDLVPVCCFEKLPLASGRGRSDPPVYPSDLYPERGR